MKSHFETFANPEECSSFSTAANRKTVKDEELKIRPGLQLTQNHFHGINGSNIKFEPMIIEFQKVFKVLAITAKPEKENENKPLQPDR